MPVDPKLIELAKVAESGRPVPVIRVATASQLFVGRPGGAWHFEEGSTMGLQAYAQEQVRTVVRGQRDAAFQQVLGNLQPDWHRAASVPEPDPPTSLTMYDTLVWAWGEGSGLRLPVVRVNLEAVTAWWLGGGEVVKGHGGGGWFYGISVPLGD